MKNALLPILLTLAVITQSQVVFCPSGANWKCAFNSGGFPPALSYNYEVAVSYDGDLLLGNDSVKILNSSKFFLGGNTYNSSSIFIKQKGDTIFFNTVYTRNKWQILFNYAAQSGGKWNNTLYPNAQFNDTSVAISYTSSVISTQNCVINGHTLKQLTIGQQNNALDGLSYIKYNLTERFGSDQFVFSFAGEEYVDGPQFMENLCYSDDVFGYYYYGGSSCLLTTGIKANSEKSPVAAVYPNPINEFLNLKLDETHLILGTCFYRVYNGLGEQVSYGVLTTRENKSVIDLSNLSDGIYTLKLENKENAALQILRFVKRN